MIALANGDSGTRFARNIARLRADTLAVALLVQWNDPLMITPKTRGSL